jgi:hypothetical protein
MDYGALGLAAGLSFAIAREALAVLRSAIEAARDGKDPTAPPLQMPAICALDQNKLGEVHKTIRAWDRNITQFHCAWRDRDEVRDMLEALRALSAQMATLSELLRREQNGRARDA